MLGKIQVKQEYPPATFIDEAVEKYHSLEQEHNMEKKGVKNFKYIAHNSFCIQNSNYETCFYNVQFFVLAVLLTRRLKKTLETHVIMY